LRYTAARLLILGCLVTDQEVLNQFGAVTELRRTSGPGFDTAGGTGSLVPGNAVEADSLLRLLTLIERLKPLDRKVIPCGNLKLAKRRASA
jgi:hypothetical protein